MWRGLGGSQSMVLMKGLDVVGCDGDDRVDGKVKEQSLERGILRLFRTDYHFHL
jgi:hypothetical protein